ncbi:MAG: transposase family protein [PVC group bacterium]|nr:transposase family protein [PVC group bacterium]
MRLKLQERQKITQMLSGRYQKARKKEKVKILDEYIELTQYNRAYASYLLNNWGKKIWVNTEKENLVYVLGKRKKKERVNRKRYYGNETLNPWKKVWIISGMICGKLLKKFIEDNLDLLRGYEEIQVDKKERAKLLKISPATIDRMLSPEKKKLELKARSSTKPGTLLKHKIPIRTFAQWDEKRPGFFEIDLVSHNGGDPRGEFIQTLDATDVYTTWTETEAVLNKAQVYVFQGIKKIRSRLSYKMLGMDSDNGGEFINDELYRYCVKEKLTFTRGRANRKNDNCYVEQKNYSIVRKTVGYYRYEGEEDLKLLNDIYEHLRLITNYFIPTMKLVKKERFGGKVTRKYDKPKTPYERVLESKHIEKEEKEMLKKVREKLNPAQLRRDMVKLQNKLFKTVQTRKRTAKAA